MAQTTAIGYVNFDSSSTDSNELEIMVPQESMQNIKRGQYVRIESEHEGDMRNFFARISKGPFFVPDAVSKDSAFARAAILHAGKVKFKPDFHAVCYAQIIGELDMKEMKTYGTFVRPRPQAGVFPLTGEQIEKFLGLEGDMFIGQLNGYSGVKVRLPSDKNAALPRNVGIFGTVGSGKTNTSQVLIEEAASHNWAVVVLDVEGEYVDMDKPSEQRQLEKLFGQFGIKPSGVKNLDVYHPVDTEPARQDISKPFSIRFSNVEPQILAEIMGLSQPQNERFLEIWHNLAQKEVSKKKKTKTKAGFAASLAESFDGGPALGITLEDIISQIDSILESDQKNINKSSYYVLRRKLKRLERFGIFDREETMDYSELIQANRVSVIDLSSSSNDQVNNIVLMDILRKIFKLKLEDKKKELPPVLIAIEEAHTLVSRENASKMEETLDILKEISRRGRKRWISLCFISQQPSHLPPEIYELCNTKVAHQITGGRNLEAIRSSTGGVDPSVWDDVPQLGQGTCMFISSYFKNRPMFVNVRPCMSKRRHVEEE